MNTKYIDAMLALHECNKSELSAFLLLLKDKIGILNVDDTTYVVFLLKDTKEQLAKELDIGIRQVERLISKCVDAGILKKSGYRGKYSIDITVFPTEKQLKQLESFTERESDFDARN